MTQFILLVVLSAAFLDAVQHSLIKSRTDAFAMALVVAILGGIVAIAVLAVTGLPDPAAYPWLVVSVALGCLYWVALGWAYQTGTLALVFPVSRGTGVLLTTLGAVTLIGESLSTVEVLTVLTVLAGLTLVALQGTKGKGSWRGIGPSLVLAVIISAFTLVDASGVRVAGSAAAYCGVLYLGNAIGIGLYGLTCYPSRIRALGAGVIPPAFAAAGLSLLTYFLILYGMKHAPVAVVAALAETSIVFAALIGVLWLREPARIGHLAGIAMVASGVVVLRLTH